MKIRVLAVVVTGLLTACGGGSSSSSSGPTVASSAPPVAAPAASTGVVNTAPVAASGSAQNVVAGAIVTLDGSTSSDVNSDPLTYLWTLTSKPTGSSATLSGAATAKPTFTADVAGTYTASLVVNDGKANSTNASVVTITAAVANVAPVANAGALQNVTTGSVVTLDGSASSDANSDALTYVWALTTKPAGSFAALSTPTSVKPVFTADVAGTYVATLTVNDGKISSSTSTVTVTATVANAVPVANAGSAQKVAPGAVVTIDGSASSDANGDALTYTWTLSKPPGSLAVLSNASSSKPTFTADIVGTYVGSLIVSDGTASSIAKTVAITAVDDLSLLFSKSASSGGMAVGTFWQPGSAFSLSITNNSNEVYSLTKYELLNAGAVINSTTDQTLLSDGQLTPGETVGITVTFSQARQVDTAPGNGLRGVYYLTHVRTGQQFKVSHDFSL
jgi:hypothetical protein